MTYHLAYTAPLLEPWRDKAACAGRFDVFFPAEASDTDDAEAKKICGTCPVASQCLSSALADEGKAPVYARVGVRGGYTSLERGQIAGVAEEPEEDDPHVEMDRLLRLGTMTDKDIAAQLGAASVTVHRRRQALGLPVVRLNRSSLEEIFASGARPVDGGKHVVWRSSATYIVFNGQNVAVTRLAFSVGHGRTPDGWVFRSCEHPSCIAWQHLTDNRIRAQLRESLGEAA